MIHNQNHHNQCLLVIKAVIVNKQTNICIYCNNDFESRDKKSSWFKHIFHFISFGLKYFTRGQVNTWLPKISKYCVAFIQ